MLIQNRFISLVIPYYNEENRVSFLLTALEEFYNNSGLNFETILVDDGSADKSTQIIESNSFIQKLKAENRCTVIIKKKNAGKGEALKTGVANTNGEFIVTMDADIATHPIEVVNWLNMENGKFDAKKVYIGSRELPESKITSGVLRRITGRVFNLIVRFFTPLNLKDTQCGFKLYHFSIGKKVFADLVNTGWAHDIELLYRAKKLGCSIKEMKITWNSVEGSKVSVMRDSWRMLIETIKISRLLR